MKKRSPKNAEAFMTTQVCNDLDTGKQFKIKVSNSGSSKTEIDAIGGNVNKVYFPNISGVVSFKDRVALVNSMKLTGKVIPDLKYNLNGSSEAQIYGEGSPTSRIESFQLGTDSKNNQKYAKKTRNIIERKGIAGSTDNLKEVLKINTHLGRYSNIKDRIDANSELRKSLKESNNPYLTLNQSKSILGQMKEDQKYSKRPLLSLETFTNKLNNKEKLNRYNNTPKSIDNFTSATILPNLSMKKLHFKTKLIKANDENIGVVDLIKEQKLKDLENNQNLNFDMNTKYNKGFGLGECHSPTIKDLISKSFTPFISKISNQAATITRNSKDIIKNQEIKTQNPSTDDCLESSYSDTDFDKLAGEPYSKLDDYSPVKTNNLLQLQIDVHKTNDYKTQRSAVKKLPTPVKEIRRNLLESKDFPSMSDLLK